MCPQFGKANPGHQQVLPLASRGQARRVKWIQSTEGWGAKGPGGADDGCFEDLSFSVVEIMCSAPPGEQLCYSEFVLML